MSKIILGYDTETSGLPLFKEPSDHPSQPHIIELAAKLVVEDTREVVGAMNVLIQPEGFEISQEITDLTGITHEMAVRYGVPMAQALEMFIAMWRLADLRVAHNETFDNRLVRIALKRDEVFSAEMVGDEEFPDHWKAAPAFCTQTNSTKIINLPPTEKMLEKRMKGPKSPNLGEAYEFFTGRPLVGAHRAMADVDACLEVYFGIKDHERKPEPAPVGA